MIILRNNFTNRLIAVFLFFVTCYCLILCRLYFIQVLYHDFYSAYAKNQYTISLQMYPDRGQIYDRLAKPLAINRNAYSAFVIPNNLQQKKELLSFLQREFPYSYNRLKNNFDLSFLFLERNISAKTMQKLQDSNIKDIKFMQEPQRYYPLACAVPVVGVTNIDNHGASGLEYSFDQQLRGTPTTYIMQQDAKRSNFYFKKEITAQGLEGLPLYLTLDAQLQELAYHETKKQVQLYNADSGATIIMDPSNGDILAMSSIPCCNPNDKKTITQSLLKNSVISDAYELGSVMKTFCALAALSEKVVSVDTVIDCQNTINGIVNGRTFTTVRPHGLLSFEDVVARSNNIGIAIVAQSIGEVLYDHYAKLGFGKSHQLGLSGENPGVLHEPRYWSKQSLISLSFGYEVSVTLLQLASAFCAIANNGYSVNPRILLSETTPEKEQLYKYETIQELKRILAKTVRFGTARRAYIPGVDIYAKTGTANLIVDGEYQANKNIFTCAGIIEHGNYVRVIVTCVRNAKSDRRLYASSVAVPLFKNITQQMLLSERVLVS